MVCSRSVVSAMYITVLILSRICRPQEKPLPAGRVRVHTSSSARTKGDDTRYYLYTYLVRIPTFSFWFSVSWDTPTSAFIHSRAYVPHQVRIMYQMRMIPGTYCCIAICLLVSGWWYAWYLRSAQEIAVSLFVYSLVGGGITRTFRPWTHTSDDSHMYQLSLVVATATVSSECALNRHFPRCFY